MVKDILVKLGYRPISAQDNYRCQALYRGGKKNNSLSVHKKTGKFYDFVTKESGSLKRLVELTTGDKVGDFEEDLESFSDSLLTKEDEKPKIMAEKIWDNSELDDIFPHYKFYEDRGISKETLKLFKSGMQHSGTLNQRYVFPIINSDKKIHGWTGRDMTKTKVVKWYHLGSTRNWVYPLYIEENGVSPTREAIVKTKEVILVESVGDMLSLWERGYKNVLVIFGTKIHPKLASVLMSFNLNRVIISTNNDFNKIKNVGKMASLDVYLNLMMYFNPKNIDIALPCGGTDFGEMNDKDFEKWKKKIDFPNKEAILKAVFSRAKERIRIGKMSKNLQKIVETNMELFGYE